MVVYPLGVHNNKWNWNEKQRKKNLSKQQNVTSISQELTKTDRWKEGMRAQMKEYLELGELYDSEWKMKIRWGYRDKGNRRKRK